MRKQLDDALVQLEQFLKQEKPARQAVLDHLRTTPLPFIACYGEQLSRGEMFLYSFRFLHLLGKHNVALAVGLCMNQYIAYSLACYPAQEGSPISRLKHEFLAGVRENRWLLAVSSFDDFVRNKDDLGNQVACTTRADGSLSCSGVKNFQSNVSAADVLLFSGVVDQSRVGLFYTFLKQTPGIELGAALYPGAMADTDTRSVLFDNLVLPAQQMLPASDEGETLGLHALTRVVFAVMAMAPYMGGAQRALEEAAQFLNGVHVEGQPLASLDGYITDMGRAQVDYQICQNLIEGFESAVDTLQANNFDAWLHREGSKALALKYHVTAVCEQLVGRARKIIGTRSLLPSHILSQLSQQILFGALHPVINAKIERDFGASLLRGR
ncbi:MAG: acyl-CoA dehydrogenase family protein [Pseudomonadota bacterium]